MCSSNLYNPLITPFPDRRQKGEINKYRLLTERNIPISRRSVFSAVNELIIFPNFLSCDMYMYTIMYYKILLQWSPIGCMQKFNVMLAGKDF